MGSPRGLGVMETNGGGLGRQTAGNIMGRMGMARQEVEPQGGDDGRERGRMKQGTGLRK